MKEREANGPLFQCRKRQCCDARVSKEVNGLFLKSFNAASGNAVMQGPQECAYLAEMDPRFNAASGNAVMQAYRWEAA